MKDEIQDTLLLMGESEYRDFTSKLMPTVEKERVIGTSWNRKRKK